MIIELLNQSLISGSRSRVLDNGFLWRVSPASVWVYRSGHPATEPASRIAWVGVIATFPGFGILFYILFGETNIGERRSRRAREVLAEMPALAAASDDESNDAGHQVSELYAHLFRTAHSISGFHTVAEIQRSCFRFPTRPLLPWWRTSTRRKTMCICCSTSG